ncbi:MAG: hypothetical protein ACREV2_15425, partial [Burkholderiales bacterium]
SVRIEYLATNQGVVGSNPAGRAIPELKSIAGLSSIVFGRCLLSTPRMIFRIERRTLGPV